MIQVKEERFGIDIENLWNLFVNNCHIFVQKVKVLDIKEHTFCFKCSFSHLDLSFKR